MPINIEHLLNGRHWGNLLKVYTQEAYILILFNTLLMPHRKQASGTESREIILRNCYASRYNRLIFPLLILVSKGHLDYVRTRAKCIRQIPYRQEMGVFLGLPSWPRRVWTYLVCFVYTRYARVNREGGDFFPKLWTPEAAAELTVGASWYGRSSFVYLGHDRGKLK